MRILEKCCDKELNSEKRTHNKWFSAMLADEYILTFLSLSASVRAEGSRISAQQKVLDVVRHAFAAVPNSKLKL